MTYRINYIETMISQNWPIHNGVQYITSETKTSYAITS